MGLRLTVGQGKKYIKSAKHSICQYIWWTLIRVALDQKSFILERRWEAFLPASLGWHKFFEIESLLLMSVKEMLTSLLISGLLIKQVIISISINCPEKICVRLYTCMGVKGTSVSVNSSVPRKDFGHWNKISCTNDLSKCCLAYFCSLCSTWQFAGAAHRFAQWKDQL